MLVRHVFAEEREERGVGQKTLCEKGRGAEGKILKESQTNRGQSKSIKEKQHEQSVLLPELNSLSGFSSRKGQ